VSILNTYHGTVTGYLKWIEGNVTAFEGQIRAKDIVVAATAATRVEFRDGDGSGLLKCVVELSARGTAQPRFAPDSLPFRTKCHITLTGAADVFVYG
jgi:hypothetical protein